MAMLASVFEAKGDSTLCAFITYGYSIAKIRHLEV